MINKLSFITGTSLLEARIGGPAMLGGIQAWPVSPEGENLSLLMSLPATFINQYTVAHLLDDMMVSVFSYYSKEEYFLDMITYHGSEDLDIVRKYTKVLIHRQGQAVCNGFEIPQRLIVVEEQAGDEQNYSGSKIGEKPVFLQSEKLHFEDYHFTLQVYGGDFPVPFQDIFYLSDSVGYLFLPIAAQHETDPQIGLFFTQAT
jgi:hypothetical protein